MCSLFIKQMSECTNDRAKSSLMGIRLDLIELGKTRRAAALSV